MCYQNEIIILEALYYEKTGQTKNGELTKQNVAQIRDIVLSKTAIDSQSIVVIEVK